MAGISKFKTSLMISFKLSSEMDLPRNSFATRNPISCKLRLGRFSKNSESNCGIYSGIKSPPSSAKPFKMAVFILVSSCCLVDMYRIIIDK